jgi:rhodanese-related sulfurtransferase
MKFNKIILLIVAMSAMLFLTSCDDNDSTGPDGSALVRVIHTSYDAPAVDVWVEGDVAIEDLAYGMSSGYAEIDDGMNEIMVVPAGSNEPVVIDVELDLIDMADYTVLAVGPLAEIEPIFALDERAPVSNMAKVRFIHAAPDAPAVDIKYDVGKATPIFENKAFKSISDYVEVPGAAYSFLVTPAGSDDVVVSFEPVMVENGNVYTVVAHGTLDAEDEYPFAVRVFVDNGIGTAYVDLVPGGPAYMDISALELNQMMQADPELIVIDVSPIFADGHIPGAVNYYIGYGDLANALMYLDPLANYAVYCHTDAASMTGAQMLIDAGFNNVYRLEGNFSAWQDAGYDVEVGVAKVMTIHASPDAPGVDLLIDLVPVNSSALEYPDNTPYLDVAPGMRNIKVNVSGTQTTVIEADIDFTTMMDYSIFAVDEVAQIFAILTEDDLTAPDPGNAHVRFVHLSPDAPSVDITLSDGTMLFEDYSFIDYSDFAAFPADTYHLQARLHGTETVVLDLPGITLLDGVVYTVFARGFVSGSGDQALGAEIIVNN